MYGTAAAGQGPPARADNWCIACAIINCARGSGMGENTFEG